MLKVRDNVIVLKRRIDKEMAFKELLGAIKDVGFPIAVAGYLVWFLTRFMTKTITEMTRKIDEINGKLDKIIEILKEAKDV